MPGKLAAFTFADPPDGNCDDRLLAEIYEDMKGQETILDLLKFYSDELKERPEADSPCFVKLHELFNRGRDPEAMPGFFRGVLISFRSEGLLRVFDRNILNMAWGVARLFSPWTGKTFEDIDSGRLGELTDGNEAGEVRTSWGANTYSLRTTRRRFVGQLMKVAGIWTSCAGYGQAAPLYTCGRLSNAQPATLAERFVRKCGSNYCPSGALTLEAYAVRICPGISTKFRTLPN